VRLLTALIVLGLVAAACGGSSSDTTLPEVDSLLADSAAAMTALEYAGFQMNTEGAAVTIEGLTFRAADGAYAAPDSARGILTMQASGLTVDLATISVGERTWLTSPLTGRWEELRAGTGFNPAIFFGPEGWAPLLTEDLSGAAVTGVSSGEYVVTGRVAEHRVEFLTAGIASDQDVDIELRIDTETLHLTHAEFSTVGDEGTTDWEIRLFDFDEPVTIEPPTP
jgi:ABC-type amino acid transport substrate-binding protein